MIKKEKLLVAYFGRSIASNRASVIGSHREVSIALLSQNHQFLYSVDFEYSQSLAKVIKSRLFLVSLQIHVMIFLC